MLDMLTKFICSIFLSMVGFYVIKIVLKSDEKLFTIRNLLLISILIIVPPLLYSIEYTSTYTLITYLLNILVYKKIFKQSVIQSIISSSMFMVILFLSDIINFYIYIPFISITELRGVWYYRLLSNTTLCIISIILCNIKNMKNILNKFELKLENTRYISSAVFLTLLILVLSLVEISLYKNFGYNINFIINTIVMIIFLVLLIIFFNEKNNNDKLTAEYDNLFNYVQNFEDWIEKEQLNRHEYKNQLAVLRCMTKDKKVVNKIDEILEDSINVDGEVVNQLKAMPKGGIKGLMYYKAAIAQKRKVNLTIDVSLERKSILTRLSEKDMRVLCKLIGIYFDNAIEAAIETRKKIVTIEIYELKDHVSFVISNTFKEHKDMARRNEKGVSSKGEGHGNGLYFASKLITKNNWLTSRQDIVDKYYIQELSIKLPNKETNTKKDANN